MTDDPINPNHYKGARWEVIEIIEAHGLDHFRATALAYILRASRKNGDEDLRKAVWYLHRLADSSLNIAAAAFAVTLDPEAAKEMSGDAVADDFGILAPSPLRQAVVRLVPNPHEFSGSIHILEDALFARWAVELDLEQRLQQAAQP